MSQRCWHEGLPEAILADFARRNRFRRLVVHVVRVGDAGPESETLLRGLAEVSSGDYYGEGYQDILTRVPSIENGRKHLAWEPTVDLRESLRRTIEYYVVGEGSRA